MFSRIESSGTTNMADPSVEAISMKEYVWLPTVADSGGSENCGRPGFTSPATHESMSVEIAVVGRKVDD